VIAPIHTYGEPPRGRRSQGAKDRLGPCARIANLQADPEHTKREMALAVLLPRYAAETPFSGGVGRVPLFGPQPPTSYDSGHALGQLEKFS
jgi:hypothetical protein